MYINGEWIHSDQQLDVKNPATGEVVDTVHTVGVEETEQAIQAANDAFYSWRQLTADQRSDYLLRISQKIEEKKEYLAQIITMEMGKSIHNSRTEAASAASLFKWFAEEARRVNGDIIPGNSADKRMHVLRQPVGVVAAITPWNFPLSMGARKLAPAMAVGCTVILRPSSEAPLSSLEMFKIFDEVGLPKGVANLVIGSSGPIGETLMGSQLVRKISFTGSTEVGKTLIRQSADTVKRVSMELGGHAPYIVFDDADLDIAVDGVARNKFASSGQQCVATNRVYVHDSIYDKFAAKFQQVVSAMRVGNGLDESNQMGSLVNEHAINNVHGQVEDALAKGATLFCGGERLTEGEHAKGYFYAPTVIGDVTDEMKISVEETFGPIAPLFRFRSEDEVIAMANNTNYGLAAYFYTNDLSRMYRVSEQLEYGMIGVNDPFPFGMQAPFGGVKESGLGRESGKYGLEDYLEYKSVSVVIK